MPGRRALGVLGCRAVAAALLAAVALRLSGWSSGPAAAMLLVAAAAVLVAAHVWAAVPGLVPAGVPPGAGAAPRLRVVTANLLVGNTRLPDAGRALRALQPDVLVLVELRPASLARLRDAGALDALPHSTVDGPPGDVEIFSRLPLDDIDRSTGVPGLPQPRAVVDVDGTRVRLRGAHPLPPVGGYEDRGRASLAMLAGETREEEVPLVVAGDLNADRHYPLFDDLLALGLRDAAEERGRGLSRTWPQRLPLLALDQVLVRDGAGARLVVTGQREAALPGSDHFAVVADIAVVAG